MKNNIILFCLIKKQDTLFVQKIRGFQNHFGLCTDQNYLILVLQIGVIKAVLFVIENLQQKELI